MICNECGGWYLDPPGRPLNQDGCDNIGMDYKKQCLGHAQPSDAAEKVLDGMPARTRKASQGRPK